MEEIYYKGQKIDKDEINESLKQIQNSALFEATEDAQKLMNKKTGGLEFRKKHDKSSHDKIKKIKTMLASFLYQVKYPKRIPEFDKLMKPEKFNTGLFGLKVHYVDPKKPIEDAAKEAEVFFNDLEAKGGGNFKLADFMTGIQHSERQEEKENESVEFISDEDNEQYLIEQYFTQFVPILNEDDSTIDSSNNYIDQSVKDERDKKNNSDEYINNYLGGYVKRIINKLSDSMNALAMTEELSQLISGLNSTLEYVMSGGESAYINKEFEHNNEKHKLKSVKLDYDKALSQYISKYFTGSTNPALGQNISKNVFIFLFKLFRYMNLISTFSDYYCIVCNIIEIDVNAFITNLNNVLKDLNNNNSTITTIKNINFSAISKQATIISHSKKDYDHIDMDKNVQYIFRFFEQIIEFSGGYATPSPLPVSIFSTSSTATTTFTFKTTLKCSLSASTANFGDIIENLS